MNSLSVNLTWFLKFFSVSSWESPVVHSVSLSLLKVVNKPPSTVSRSHSTIAAKWKTKSRGTYLWKLCKFNNNPAIPVILSPEVITMSIMTLVDIKSQQVHHIYSTQKISCVFSPSILHCSELIWQNFALPSFEMSGNFTIWTISPSFDGRKSRENWKWR